MYIRRERREKSLKGVTMRNWAMNRDFLARQYEKQKTNNLR